MTRKSFNTGAWVLALCVVAGDVAAAKTTTCATPEEASALQATIVQEQLMDAALGCGADATQHFNAFQTVFGSELRKSDALMLRMFKRVMGNVKGDAEYNAFKTRVASEAEIRRVRGFVDFCKTADFIFAAALAPIKPSLEAFAASVTVEAQRPVASCTVNVAANLDGAADVVPQPRPPLPDDRPQ